MALRDEWRFEFPVSRLVEAADARIDYHQEHLDYWRGERDRTEAELREHGLEIRAHEVTGGKRLEASFDSSLERRYAEACSKIERHQASLTEYERWYRVFELENVDRMLELDFADVQFFDL